MTQFARKKVLITGGGSGIGRLMAGKIAGKGATVIIWDIDEKKLSHVESELKKLGCNLFAYICDVSDRQKVYCTAQQVKKDTGKVDILINNAGIVSGKPLLECTDEQIEKTFQVNSLALIWTIRAFLPDMINDNQGHIVNISSAAGLIGTAGLVDYAASKFAAFGIDESIRVELKKNGSKVRTTVVCPYYINTGMFEGVKTRFSWLLPILDENFVAEKIVHAIEKNRTRLIMPWIVYAVLPLRMLPTSAFDFLAGLLGVHDTMSEFKGRKT